MTHIAKEPLLTEAKAIASDDAFGVPRIIHLIEDAPSSASQIFDEFEALVRRNDVPITIPGLLECKPYKELKKKYKCK